MDLQTALFYFYIYAFFGWCVEVTYSAVNHGVFINRGFLNGPVCPIYGFGVTAVLFVLTPLKDRLLLLYVCSVLLTSALELATGFFMDKLFHHKWWDYSKNPLNIGGYVCLKFSLLWGLACVLVVDALQPVVARFVLGIPEKLGVALLIAFSCAFLADAAVTLNAVAKLNLRLTELDEIAAALHRLSDAIGENVAENAIQLDTASDKARSELVKERQTLLDHREALFHRVHMEQKRILSAFPDLESRRHPEILSRVKERMQKGI